MATRTATKARKTKAPEVDPEEDELAGLDEELAALESATDLDDLDLEEPDDTEFEEDEAPVKRTRAKKAAPVEEDEEELEEDEEEELEEDDVEDLDEEDEGDEFDALDRAGLKAHIKSEGLDVKVYKSHSDDDIRDAIRAGEESEEMEVTSEPPKKKGPGRPKKDPDAPTRAPKEPTKGSPFTADDVAVISGIPDHQVRLFASKHPKAFPKASPKARYAFNARQVRALLKGLGVLAS
jgi:hypothetical protein